MSQFKLADRLATLPPYLFAEIDRLKSEVAAQGIDIISLGIGDPDLPTPDFIIEELHKAAQNPVNHQYPSYIGLLTFREAVADWYKERFNVELDAKTEVVSLIGSKEGIAHFPLAFVNPGDLVLVCSPNYPVYPVASEFAGGVVEFVPMTEENNFLPDLDAIDAKKWDDAKAIFVNFPNNPTSATATAEFYTKLVNLAKKHNVIIAADAAYTEVYYDENKKPISILEIDGAKDVAIEFHSLSKTYNMTGWRLGMAVGNKDLVAGLGKIKENVDSGVFQAVQEAGIAALKKGEPYVKEFRKIYKERRDCVIEALNKINISCMVPEASIFVWAKTPEGYTSSEFVSKLLKETGVVVTPGNGFGESGEGYFRISLTVNTDRLKEAVSRISQL